MTLLTDQRLEELRAYLSTPATRHETIPCILQQGVLCALVERELERRKHGPFTFAEARASGRPYRRLAWTESYRANEWATHIYVDQEETYFTNADGNGIAAFDEESAVATDYVLHD